jgi:site-specific DNA-methyltransferase (adenine-specific)
MPESVEDRCTRAHEYIFMFSKKSHYHYDHEAIKEDAVGVPHSPGNKNVTQPKEKGARDPGLDPDRVWASDGKKNKRSVWTVNTKGYKGAHFAVYPETLITPCVLAGCPQDGTVFDPFTGSGTTAVVALRHGRNYIGTELNPEYVQIAENRIAESVPQSLSDFLA